MTYFYLILLGAFIGIVIMLAFYEGGAFLRYLRIQKAKRSKDYDSKGKGKVYAPFEPEQIQNLEKWQNSGYLHPFTCPHHSNNVLKVYRNALYCDATDCEYEQHWVHRMMVEPTPANPISKLKTLKSDDSR